MWVKSGKAHSERMLSSLPPKADMGAHFVSARPNNGRDTFEPIHRAFNTSSKVNTYP